MARWYIARSPETLDEDNEGELIAYQALKSLDDSWTIRWCYDYLDGEIPKEGDFLILGPDGRLLVLEVKTRARVFTPTGQRDGEAGSRAEDQVQAQKACVLDALEERYQKGGGDLQKPWTVAAIFSAKEHGYQPKTHAHPFSLIGGPDQLRKLPQYWKEITSGGFPTYDTEAVRNLFHAVYGDASPEAEARFISETDRLLIEKASADFSLLEA
ncbi:MAG: NERD domain-containing protein, partial [Chitinophagia bacterium]|nr:NERD domain-containing protein [Chitinophagia bacterium]